MELRFGSSELFIILGVCALDALIVTIVLAAIYLGRRGRVAAWRAPADEPGMTMAAAARLRHSPDATYQTVAGEAILIHLKTGVYYSLNEVGTVFWKMLDGARTIADCAAAIAAEYAAPLDVVTADLLDVAADLVKEGLAETI